MKRGPVLDRLVWALYKRHRMARRVESFEASPFSYVYGRVQFEGHNKLYEQALVADATLGRFTYVAARARVVNSTVGRYCSIGPGALIGGLGVHPTRWASTHPVFFSTRGQASATSFAERDHLDESPPVSVGNDVWIGANAVVLDGRRIGDGAIIAAGAVVAKDVAPYAIVGGVPASVIRMRFDAATVAGLLKLQWWDWPLEVLRQRAHEFRSDDVAALAGVPAVSAARAHQSRREEELAA